MNMDGWLIIVWVSVIVSLTYCRVVTARLPPGKRRLVSLLPVLYGFAVLPLYTSSMFFTAVNALFITWLSTFKLLLFAFNRGPIASPPSSDSLPVFIAMAALPFTIAAEPRRKGKALPLNLATEIPLAAVIISVVYDHKDNLSLYILLPLYVCLMFLLVDFLVELSSFAAGVLLGLELEPASDEPYLSTSVREFWSRRWNITVGRILREAVYQPVRSVAEPAVGRGWAALPAVVATFVVSGLMHELILWYMIRAPPSWEMTMFFVVQGAGVVAESALEIGLAENKWRVPPWVRRPLSLGFVAATGFWLFFPPLMRNGVDTQVIGECRFAGEMLKKKVMALALSLPPLKF